MLKAGEEEKIVDDKGNEVTILELKRCYREYAPVISLLVDYDTGVFHFTKADYLTVPDTFIQALRIWKSVKQSQEKK